MNNILTVNGQPILVNGQVVSVGDTGYGGSGFSLTQLFDCGDTNEASYSQYVSLREGILTFPTFKMWSGFLVQYIVSTSKIYYFAAMNLSRSGESWYATYCDSSQYGMLAADVITHSAYSSSSTTSPAYLYTWSWNLANSTGVANIYDGTDLSKLIIYGIN